MSKFISIGLSRLLTLAVSVAAGCVSAQGITGTWHVNGFDFNAETNSTRVDSFSGTLEITSTSGGSYRFQFVGSTPGDTEDFNVNLSRSGNRFVSSGTYEDEDNDGITVRNRMAIHLIHNDLLIFTDLHAGVGDRQDNNNLWYVENGAGVLTREPLAAPDPVQWAGTYDLNGFVVEIDDGSHTIRERQTSERLAISSVGASYQIKAPQETLDLFSFGNALGFNDVGTSDGTVFYEDEQWIVRATHRGDYLRILQVDANNLVAFQFLGEGSILESKDPESDFTPAPRLAFAEGAAFHLRNTASGTPIAPDPCSQWGEVTHEQLGNLRLYGNCWFLWPAGGTAAHRGFVRAAEVGEAGTQWLHHAHHGWLKIGEGSVDTALFLYSADRGEWIMTADGPDANTFRVVATGEVVPWVPAG